MPKQMQKKKIPDITPHQAERSMYAAWQLLDVIKKLSKEQNRTYATVDDLFEEDKFVVHLVANENVEVYMANLAWAINLEIVNEHRFVMTLPNTVLEWFVKHTHTYNSCNKALRLEALIDLYKGKANIVGVAE